MATRLELELTSARPDGSWTWRKAGARQPKGVLEGSILYEGAKVGDVVRADADVQIDGITILSVTPPRQKASAPDRLEIVGPPREAGPGVTTSLVPKGSRRPGGRDRERPDRPRGEGPAGRDQGPRRREGPDRDRPGRPREGGDRDRTGQGPRGERGAGGRPPGAERGPRDRPGQGPPGPDRPRGARPARDGAPGDRPRPDRRGGQRSGDSEERSRPERAAPKRLTPGTKHRDAVLADLSPEQRPIAEQVLRGGMPAVRQAIAGESEKAKAEGRPPIAGEPLLAIAEELLPRLKAASWRDRAEAVVPILDEVSIRDLRSVVAGSDAVARDDETRMLASAVRDALERRLEQQRTAWVTDITSNLTEGRVVRALRLSARPPDPGVRFPAELAVRLAEAAGAALAPDVPADRWAAVLDAVAASPVRRSVRPAGLPEGPPEDLLTVARQTAGRVPALAPLLGLPMPPPPGPARSAVAGRPMARPPRPTGPRPPAPRRPAPTPLAEAPPSSVPAPPAHDAAAPTAEAPTPEAPTPEASTPEASTPEAPAAEAPAAEAPTAEAPAVEASTAEPPAAPPAPAEPEAPVPPALPSLDAEASTAEPPAAPPAPAEPEAPTPPALPALDAEARADDAPTSGTETPEAEAPPPPAAEPEAPAPPALPALDAEATEPAD